mmetsp:Transcript_8164/g.14803  ORF Transcript_8164/g.14803 Transcript_8164/m.14803 type:complete len:217 (+) Transcript_8164:141-791(+)
MVSSNLALLLLVAATTCPSITSFTNQLSSPIKQNTILPPLQAGFGGAASPSKKKGKKEGALPKLKAKSQWDRYNDLAKTTKCATVGVRIKSENEETTNEWMEVGRVRSENDEIEVAIARQRALIAEHSKRLFIVEIPSDAVLEWGVRGDGEEGEWSVVDKSKGDGAAKGIEKKIGFEGISDEATGFYCLYHEGRVIAKKEQPKGGAGAAFKNVKGK